MTRNLRILSDKLSGNTKAVFSVSLILMLAMTMMMTFAQPSSAQEVIPQPVKTAGFASIAPTLIGVGQQATVNLWVFPGPKNYAQDTYYQGYNGVTVTFVKPDGSKDTFMPVDGTGTLAPGQTESIGSIFFFYKPDMAGNWSVSFTMPAQNITDDTGTIQYTACTSNTASFTVQTDPVNAGLLNGYPWAQLPNDNTYWSYPINSNNREWSQISGDWLQYGLVKSTVISGVGCNLWQPYGSGPNTGHVVWSQPLNTGGIVGGDYGSRSYGSPNYAGQGAVVMDGKVFVNIPNAGKFECIDLTTGQVLYTADGSIQAGLRLPGDAYALSFLDPSVVLANSYGAYSTPYLFGTSSPVWWFFSGPTWNFYDPLTGTLMRSIDNASASIYRLVDGTNFAYGIEGDNLFAWDMSQVVDENWPTGITWTSPLFEPSASLLGISADLSTIVLANKDDAANQYWGFSAKDGTSLWNLTIPYSVGEAFALYRSNINGFVTFNPVDATFHCYSMLTGAELWTSESFADSPWTSQYTVYNSWTNDENNLYLMFPDGSIRALSLQTGDLVWESTAFASTEYTNNVVPYWIGMVMEGGNIYTYGGYSVAYQINPIPRQGMLVCTNATTGDTT